MVRAEAKQAAASAEGSPVLHALARVGFVVLGLVHAIIGVLAFVITRDPDDVEVDQTGAMAAIAQTPVGGVLLWSTAIALLALSVWELLETILVPGLTGLTAGPAASPSSRRPSPTGSSGCSRWCSRSAGARARPRAGTT